MEFDKDLTARQEARELARRAETAQRKLAELSQSQLDAIVEAVAKAFAAQASALAEMAVQETGFGNAEDKRAKNLFASQRVAEAVRGMKTVGHSPGSPGEKALGDRRAGGGHRRHRPQHQPHLYGVLQGHDRPEIGQCHRVFSPPQGHCLHPESGADRIGSGAGGGRAR